MKIEEIAEVCHEINRAYCQALGDNSQPIWGEAPDWQKMSAIMGVTFHLRNPNSTPRDSHESWLRKKRLDGWKYGSEKSPERKEHPCCVPYDELSESDRVKDHIFTATVNVLGRLTSCPNT